MKRNIWLWTALILLLVLSLPSIISRWNVEVENNTYEIAIPFEEINALTETDSVTLTEALTALKDAGLTTISLEATSLQDLENYGILSVYTDKELKDILRYTTFKDDMNQDWEGYYVTIPDENHYQKMIQSFFKTEEVVIGEIPMYFIPKSDDYTHRTKFAYDEIVIQSLVDYGYSIILRVHNNDSEVINQYIVDQLVALKNEHIHGILGAGMNFIGYGHEEQLQNTWPVRLNDAGYYFYLIENGILRGQHNAMKITGYDVVRLHSIDVNNPNRTITFGESINIAKRAVKERNIRSIFYHIDENVEPEIALENATAFVSTVQDSMPKWFHIGVPTVFNKVNVPVWSPILLILAGSILIYLALNFLRMPKLQIAGAIGMLLLGIMYFVTNRMIFLQGFALIIAVVAPIFAVLSCSKMDTSGLKNILRNYIRAIGISFVGIWIIVGLLNGNGFITGFEIFRGVKLVYFFPIAAVALLVFWELGKKYLLGGKIKNAIYLPMKVLKADVKVWHLVVFALVAAVGYYYLSRTGNAGYASELELAFRQWLDNTLYVRPRTKEFLIGFPFFVLALYVIGKKQDWGKILLIPGVIGFLSIVNTFTHFHIPIYISLLRTFYGVIFGFLIGLVLIFIVKKGYETIMKLRTRWS